MTGVSTVSSSVSIDFVISVRCNLSQSLPNLCTCGAVAATLTISAVCCGVGFLLSREPVRVRSSEGKEDYRQENRIMALGKGAYGAHGAIKLDSKENPT